MGDLTPRIQAVRERVRIADVVGAAVRLGRGSQPRGKCPFHGSKSDSLAVYPDSGRARCWGCGWGGDAIEFVRDFYGLGFVDALCRLEADHGLDGLSAQPVSRERRPVPAAAPVTVDSAEVARVLWSRARTDHDALRDWLRARKVPEAMLSDHWLGELRFAEAAPIRAWPEKGGPDDVPTAPAMLALMRRVEDGGCDGAAFRACGVHATYLSPGRRAKMKRRRADGSTLPARKMYGDARRAAVLLGHYRRDAHLFVGEGIETVLSGMGLAMPGADACGLAVLSLDNLQGRPLLAKGGVLPIYDPRPDPECPPFVLGHDGPVTGLIDADMAPLRGPLDRETGEPRGMAVREWAGGPVVRRTITTEERARICAALFVHAWRGAGCGRVAAIMPSKMGRDFNDEAAAVAREAV